MSSEDKTALEKLEERVANQLKPSTLIIGIIIGIALKIGEAFVTLIILQPALEQVYSIYGNVLILGIFLISSLILYFMVYQRELIISDQKDNFEAEKEIRRPKTVNALLKKAHRDLMAQLESTAEVVAASSLELSHLEEQRQANGNGQEVTAFKAELKDKRESSPPLDEKQHLKGEIDKLTDEFNPTGTVSTSTYNLPITDSSEVSFNFRPIKDEKAIKQFEKSHSEIDIIPVPNELIQEPEPEAEPEDDEVDMELSDETLEALEQAEEKPLGIVKEKIDIPIKSSKILTDDRGNKYIERADGTRDYNV